MKRKGKLGFFKSPLRFVFLISPFFLLLFCRNKAIETATLKKSIETKYSPLAFITPIDTIEDLSIKNIINLKSGNDSIHKFVYENQFSYILLQKKVKDWWDYYPYLEMGTIKHPINKELIPSPGIVLSCTKYKLNSNENLIFFYYFGDYVSSSRPKPDLIIARFDIKSHKWSIAFSGNHFEYKKEDFGEHKGSYYFLKDSGWNNIDVYKYSNGSFRKDGVRKIMLKDSADTGIRYIDWNNTYWP